MHRQRLYSSRLASLGLDLGVPIIFRSCRAQRVCLRMFESVAGALEAEDLGVVDDAVDHRGGDRRVAEDLAPAPEWQVRGQDQRRMLVA